jgi:hypothetical protein
MERAGSASHRGEPGRFTPSRVRLARTIALAADFIQILVFPAFFGGAASPADDVLDLVVAAALIWLLGWRWALLPTLVAELVPVLDLFPTWTAAVFYITWGQAADPPPA